MNRRRFLELLGMATAGTAVAYSFPSVIVPKNITTVYSRMPRGLTFLINDQTRVLQGVSSSMWSIPMEHGIDLLKTARETLKFTENKQLTIARRPAA